MVKVKLFKANYTSRMSLKSIDGIKRLTWRNVKMIFFGSGTCWLQSADSNVNLITDYFDLYINTTKLSHMFICEATKWTGTQRFKAFFYWATYSPPAAEVQMLLDVRLACRISGNLPAKCVGLHYSAVQQTSSSAAHSRALVLQILWRQPRLVPKTHVRGVSARQESLLLQK